MTYDEAIGYIHSVGWRGSKLGLERTRELLQKLGNPQNRLKFIHIAGTNGKGSVAAILSSVFRAAGLKTGLYTSPYIRRFNERMQLDGVPISDDALAELTQRVRVLAESMDDPPTEFEIITALALEWYAQLDCDIVVLETGLGGELDSTNVIPAPEVAVIASMALDHTDILGDTIELIAAAKSGIIKHGSAVASAANDSRAEAVITAACKRQGCELREVDCAALVIKKQTISETVFDYKEYKDLKIPLLGAYQPSNAALAIEAVQLLRLRGWPLGDAELREGLRSVSWPARFELLCEEPIFFLDGGHNPQGVKLARQSFESLLPGVRPTVLFGVMADKAIEEMIKELLPLASEFLCVVPGNPRALGNGALAQKIRDIGGIATECVSVADGVSAALERAKNSGAVLALGSLYMSGEILDCFDNK